MPYEQLLRLLAPAVFRFLRSDLILNPGGFNNIKGDSVRE